MGTPTKTTLAVSLTLSLVVIVCVAVGLGVYFHRQQVHNRLEVKSVSDLTQAILVSSDRTISETTNDNKPWHVMTRCILPERTISVAYHPTLGKGVINTANGLYLLDFQNESQLIQSHPYGTACTAMCTTSEQNGRIWTFTAYKKSTTHVELFSWLWTGIWKKQHQISWRRKECIYELYSNGQYVWCKFPGEVVKLKIQNASVTLEDTFTVPHGVNSIHFGTSCRFYDQTVHVDNKFTFQHPDSYVQYALYDAVSQTLAVFTDTLLEFWTHTSMWSLKSKHQIPVGHVEHASGNQQLTRIQFRIHQPKVNKTLWLIFCSTYGVETVEYSLEGMYDTQAWQPFMEASQSIWITQITGSYAPVLREICT